MRHAAFDIRKNAYSFSEVVRRLSWLEGRSLIERCRVQMSSLLARLNIASNVAFMPRAVGKREYEKFSIRGKTTRSRTENHRTVLVNSEINLSSCIDVTFPARKCEAGPTKSNVMFCFMTAVKVFKHFLSFLGPFSSVIRGTKRCQN